MPECHQSSVEIPGNTPLLLLSRDGRDAPVSPYREFGEGMRPDQGMRPNQRVRDEDLPELADLFAAELQQIRTAALWRPSGWYQDALGGWRACTALQALRVRQMTIDRCGRIDGLPTTLAEHPEELRIRFAETVASIRAGQVPDGKTAARKRWDWRGRGRKLRGCAPGTPPDHLADCIPEERPALDRTPLSAAPLRLDEPAGNFGRRATDRAEAAKESAKEAREEHLNGFALLVVIALVTVGSFLGADWIRPHVEDSQRAPRTVAPAYSLDGGR
jgi:hypothetical protein